MTNEINCYICMISCIFMKQIFMVVYNELMYVTWWTVYLWKTIKNDFCHSTSLSSVNVQHSEVSHLLVHQDPLRAKIIKELCLCFEALKDPGSKSTKTSARCSVSSHESQIYTSESKLQMPPGEKNTSQHIASDSFKMAATGEPRHHSVPANSC